MFQLFFIFEQNKILHDQEFIAINNKLQLMLSWKKRIDPRYQQPPAVLNARITISHKNKFAEFAWLTITFIFFMFAYNLKCTFMFYREFVDFPSKSRWNCYEKIVSFKVATRLMIWILMMRPKKCQGRMHLRLSDNWHNATSSDVMESASRTTFCGNPCRFNGIFKMYSHNLVSRNRFLCKNSDVLKHRYSNRWQIKWIQQI